MVAGVGFKNEWAADKSDTANNDCDCGEERINMNKMPEREKSALDELHELFDEEHREFLNTKIEDYEKWQSKKSIYEYGYNRGFVTARYKCKDLVRETKLLNDRDYSDSYKLEGEEEECRRFVENRKKSREAFSNSMLNDKDESEKYYRVCAFDKDRVCDEKCVAWDDTFVKAPGGVRCHRGGFEIVKGEEK